MADLGLKYGKVVGRFVATVGDTDSDTDYYPDVTPLSGSVTFTPSAAWLLVAGANPDPATVLPAAITCTLDDDGYLSYEDQKSVFLLATDDDGVNPSGYTYRVSFRLTLGTMPVSRPSFNMGLPTFVDDGDEIDLTTVSPVASSAGNAVVVGPEGPAGPVTNGDLGQAVSVNLADGADYSIATAQVGGTLTLTLGGDVTISVPTPASTVSGTVSLVLVQDATGSRTVTWDSAIIWPYGLAPTLSTDPGAVDLIHLFWTGQTWIGLVGGLSLQEAS